MNDLPPGLDSPLAAQACFRAILSAFSTPGKIVTLPVELTPPSCFSPAAASVLLTLVDAATGVALPGAEAAQDWLVFHTGARIVPLAQANFCATGERPPLVTLLQGTDEAPENGATLILDCTALNAGPRFRLFGPGLEHPILAPLPLDAAFVAEWQVQTRTAPRGVDILLCSGQDILALPRSLQIEEA
jgi:alpha-D-ribose 1-methylphosphonate 5-triphosphate synthase subunit PhnH